MNRVGFAMCLVFVLAGWVRPTVQGDDAVASADAQAPIVHNVYFKLKDSSDAKIAQLVAACKKYLAPQPGVTFFAAGGLADLDRPVNDRDWDVGLHVVFENRAAHDRYQDDPQHKQFIEENRDNWEKVRVFDTVGH